LSSLRCRNRRRPAAAGNSDGSSDSRDGELLASPLQPNLWRALTDNDRGGSGGTSYAAR
jgi:beta-galactosidase